MFNQPHTWTEELARFFQAWIILLASSICLRKDSHLAVEYVGPALTPGARRAVAVITGSLIAICSAPPDSHHIPWIESLDAGLFHRDRSRRQDL